MGNICAHELCLEDVADRDQRPARAHRVTHEILHGGKRTMHDVGYYRWRWSAWLAAHWHAWWFLGELDIIYVVDTRKVP